MTNPILTKIKITTKRILGKCVYAYIYIKNTIQVLFNEPNNNKRHHKNNFFNFIALIAERWRSSSVLFIGFIMLYYGIGATISSKINNHLVTELPTTKSSTKYIPQALGYVLKKQIDDSAWTPSLPIIFPASILDNLPNFQLGVKDSAKYITKRMATVYADKKLNDAAELLDYPPDIWLFSQKGKDTLAPGSAKQYRKAMALINDFSNSPTLLQEPNTENLTYIIKSLTYLLNKQISILHKHTNEHSEDFINFNADNIFYTAQGYAYTIYHVLLAISKEYQTFIISAEQYDNLTSALHYLNNAITFSPTIIKNSNLEDIFSANHLIYLSYYLSQAQINLKTIENAIITSQRK